MTFQWEDWAKDLRSIAENAKLGIDLAEDHNERLSRYLLYVQRLGAFLKKIPDIGEAVRPLEDLKDEIDLLVHHHSSDLLRPAAAPRTTATVSDRRLRMVSFACYRLFRQVGVDERGSREQVAKLLLARGFRGGRGQFGADELRNWISKIESGELPGKDTVAKMFEEMAAFRDAVSEPDAIAMSEAMLDRVRFPPPSGAKAKNARPIA